MLNRITPPGKTSPGNPNTSATLFHSTAPTGLCSILACAQEIVGRQTTEMTSAARPRTPHDNSAFFIVFPFVKVTNGTGPTMTIYGGKPGRDAWMLHPLCDEGDNGMVEHGLRGVRSVGYSRR